MAILCSYSFNACLTFPREHRRYQLQLLLALPAEVIDALQTMIHPPPVDGIGLDHLDLEVLVFVSVRHEVVVAASSKQGPPEALSLFHCAWLKEDPWDPMLMFLFIYYVITYVLYLGAYVERKGPNT